MNTITTQADFVLAIEAGFTDKAAADFNLQKAADYAVNQCVEYGNTNAAAFLLKQMQTRKYGNIGGMAQYLRVKGYFDITENRVAFSRGEEVKPPVVTGDKAVWTAYAKTERIVADCNDSFIREQIAALLKRAKGFAEKHPEKAASNSTISALAAIAHTA